MAAASAIAPRLRGSQVRDRRARMRCGMGMSRGRRTAAGGGEGAAKGGNGADAGMTPSRPIRVNRRLTALRLSPVKVKSGTAL